MQPRRPLSLLQLPPRHSHIVLSLEKTPMWLSQALLQLTFLVIMLRSRLLRARQIHSRTPRIQQS
jgi:hypothetical protein